MLDQTHKHLLGKWIDSLSMVEDYLTEPATQSPFSLTRSPSPWSVSCWSLTPQMLHNHITPCMTHTPAISCTSLPCKQSLLPDSIVECTKSAKAITRMQNKQMEGQFEDNERQEGADGDDAHSECRCQGMTCFWAFQEFVWVHLVILSFQAIVRFQGLFESICYDLNLTK